MMTDRQKEIWMEIYYVANEIGRLEPWEKYSELDPFVYKPQGGEEVFFSILGQTTDPCGIAVFYSLEDYLAAHSCTGAHFENEHNDPRLGIRNVTVGLWGDREDVSKENRALLKELGIRCRGDGAWLNFMVCEGLYEPRALTHEETVRLADALENLWMMLQAAGKNRPAPQFDKGKIMMRVYHEKDAMWYNFTTEPECQLTNVRIITQIEETESIRALAKLPQTGSVYSIDLWVGLELVRDRQTKRRYYPLSILVLDEQSGEVVMA